MHPTLPYLLTSSDDMIIKLWDWDNVSRCSFVRNASVMLCLVELEMHSDVRGTCTLRHASALQAKHLRP